MGVRTDPGYKLFDVNCLECFPPGETPKKMYAYFSGIKLIDPNVPAPGYSWHNDWFLEQSGPCTWEKTIPGEGTVVYIASAGGQSSVDFTKFIYNIFNSVKNETCQTAFDNQNMPGVPFTIAEGGRCQIFARPVLPFPSIRGIMEKLNIEPHRNTMFEGFPLDDTHAIAKYCRVRDSTNIKIKFEI